MSKTMTYLRKIGIALVGFPILVLGVILIPLPGPGILVCLVGLMILSIEFEWSKKYVDMAKSRLKQVMDKARAAGEARVEKSDKTDTK